MWKDFKVIDADAHMHEPQYFWERYVEPEYRDRVPKVAFMVYEPDGKIVPKGALQPRPPESAWRAMEEKYGEAYRTWWSAETRLDDMDRHGWDIQILLPTGNNGNFGYRVAPTADEAKRKILWDNAVKLFGPRILSGPTRSHASQV